MRSAPRRKSPRRFTVVSTCPEYWGGSEELWSGATCVLAERGHSFSCFKTAVDVAHPSIRRLKSLSCAVRNLPRLRLPQPLVTRLHLLALAVHLTARRPDLVVISQGDNYDGLHFGYLCRKLRIPYALVSQKAADHFWPPDKSRRYRRDVFEGAARCFFVSEHNRRLTEDQIGATLKNASVVRNPYLVASDQPLPWPSGEEDCLRLACVARLYLLDKGQDILLRVLAREKWKGRDLRVSFFGRGINREGLAGLAARLDLRNVSFEGQTDDVTGIWKRHHALVLPSRSEGLPLSLVEAMMCGRPAIVTKVGGSPEVVEDRVTGFLADPSEDSLDAALEEAWERRRGLREMGLLAARRIRELVPANPAAEFADALLEIAGARKEMRPGGAGDQAVYDEGSMSEQTLTTSRGLDC
ncbi:MAG: glycosyltransferase family 4 protein [Pyrinomonadaceae bacterium]